MTKCTTSVGEKEAPGIVGRKRPAAGRHPGKADQIEAKPLGASSAMEVISSRLPHIRGDRVQLQQVLLNLIINAMEAMRDIGENERELLISSRNEPDGVSVEVRDSGQASHRRILTAGSRLSTPRN